MCCDVYSLVRDFFFARETELDFLSESATLDEDEISMLLGRLLIPSGVSSTDYFDFSMYLYDCPPTKGGRGLPFKVCFPCKELENRLISTQDLGLGTENKKYKLELNPPIWICFKYTPVNNEKMVNMHHFSLNFTDNVGHVYQRNTKNISEKNLARHLVTDILYKIVVRDVSKCVKWDHDKDSQLFSQADFPENQAEREENSEL